MPSVYCANCPPERQEPRSLDELVAHVFTEHRGEKPETFRVVLPLPKLVTSKVDTTTIGTAFVSLPQRPLDQARGQDAGERP